jgi:hypothetical protein
MLGVAMLVAATVWVATASAKAPKPPAAQSRPCDANGKCDAPLCCVAHASGTSTCELVCKDSTTCPEDQRCVKDGAVMDCRPTTDL